jgi:hypothetical protein
MQPMRGSKNQEMIAKYLAQDSSSPDSTGLRRTLLQIFKLVFIYQLDAQFLYSEIYVLH